MDYSNEKYVRLYTADTPGWRMLPWQSKALMPLLMRRVDRAGVIDLGRHGVPGLAVTVELPLDVVEPGLAGLLEGGEDAPVRMSGTQLVIPNFMAAQSASSSDAARQKASREKRRDMALALASGLVSGKDAAEIVTGSHTESRAVTAGHTESQDVTLSLAVLSCAEPSLKKKTDLVESKHSTPPRKSKDGWPQRLLDAVPAAESVLSRLAERTGIGYSARSKEHVKLIAMLIDDGHSEHDMRLVVWHRCVLWRDDDKMRQYLRPATLFARSNFANYLPEARAARVEYDNNQRKAEAPAAILQQGAPRETQR